MSKRIICLGISTFGEYLLQALSETGGVELVAVDQDEERVNAVTGFVDQPIIGNVRNRELLERLDVDRADHVVVSLGDIENSLVCVLLLRHLHARRITVKALNTEHIEILRLLRVDSIVFPEKQMGETEALRLLHPETTAVMTLSSGHRVVEIIASEKLVGADLSPPAIAERYGLHLLMTVDASAGVSVDLHGPHRVAPGDKLVLVGHDEQIARFEADLV